MAQETPRFRPYPSFSPSLLATDWLTRKLFGAVIGFGRGLLHGSTLSRPLGLAQHTAPGILGLFSPAWIAGAVLGRAGYSVVQGTLGVAQGLIRVIPVAGRVLGPLAAVAVPAAARGAVAATRAAARMTFTRDPRGKVFENLWTGIRVRPSISLLAEVSLLGAGLAGGFSTGITHTLPPARSVYDEAPFLMQDAIPWLRPDREYPTAFDALEQASLPFALHRLRHS